MDLVLVTNRASCVVGYCTQRRAVAPLFLPLGSSSDSRLQQVTRYGLGDSHFVGTICFLLQDVAAILQPEVQEYLDASGANGKSALSMRVCRQLLATQ